MQKRRVEEDQWETLKINIGLWYLNENGEGTKLLKD